MVWSEYLKENDAPRFLSSQANNLYVAKLKSGRLRIQCVAYPNSTWPPDILFGTMYILIFQPFRLIGSLLYIQLSRVIIHYMSVNKGIFTKVPLLAGATRGRSKVILELTKFF